MWLEQSEGRGVKMELTSERRVWGYITEHLCAL